MKEQLLRQLHSVKTMSIVGMCKNAGKTTMLNWLLEQGKLQGVLGLTSIGRDGESTDIVTGTEKPGIFVREGTLIATAKDMLRLGDITKEILMTTGIPTPLGEVVIVRARSAGHVQLAGPSITTQLKTVSKDIILQDGGKAIVGYDKGRVELSGSVSAKWQPIDRLGMSVVLRDEMYGSDWIPLIPAFFIDGIISPKGNVMLKASISRNYRFPTLNDLYFLPGGNPNLKNEQGFSYDAGVSFDVGKKGIYKLSGGANWFDSYIDDWIIWLPTTKGFFSPRNVKKVHAYGVEVKANFAVQPAKDWLIDLNGSYSWTPSINEGEKMSPADQSVGKQLPYVPKHSASLTGRLSWRTWAFLYKWAFYSERYTMSSNDYTLTGHLPEYFMSNVSLEKNLFFKPVDIQLKFAVNNLFNEDYLSVLSRPMPGINFEFFIGITPKFGKNKKKSENTNM